MKKSTKQLPIARPPWTLLGKRMESSVRKAFYDFEMLEGVKKLGIALSGGKDSLCLLYFLKAIIGRGFPDIPLHAMHVHGAFSCGASVHIDFLQAICDELEISLSLRESHLTLEELNCYPCSRERRRLLFEMTKEAECEAIAFGHHREDHTQTLLLNLLHKGEFAGNLPVVPMHKYGVKILRPLIYISESDIKNFAQKYGFLRVTCQCPVGQRSMRRTVAELIDELEEQFPNVRSNLASAGLLYGSDKATRI